MKPPFSSTLSGSAGKRAREQANVGIFLHLIGQYGNLDGVKVARINHCHQNCTVVVHVRAVVCVL